MPKPDALNGAAPAPIQISREVARRFLVLHHLLAPPRSLPPEPASVMAVMDRLGSLQFDPIDVAGRNHDLVLLSRIAGYRREWTDALLYEERALFEAYNKMLSILPTAELPWYRIAWDRARIQHEGGAFDEHAPLVEELLERIRADGPMSSTDISRERRSTGPGARRTRSGRSSRRSPRPGSSASPGARATAASTTWSSGCSRPSCWRSGPRRATSSGTSCCRATAATACSGRSGAYELFAGTYPRLALGLEDGLPLQATGRSAAARGARRVGRAAAGRGRGRPRASATSCGGGARSSARRRQRSRRARRPVAHAPASRSSRRSTRSSGTASSCGRASTSTTSGRSTSRRPKRRWGYYVLPLLYGDRLVGRIEPRADRKAGTLRIVDAWWEAGFDPLADEAFAVALAGRGRGAPRVRRARTGHVAADGPACARWSTRCRRAERARRSEGVERSVPVPA